VLYDDTTVVKAVTLQAASASLHHTGRAVQPSLRYLGLLQAGKLRLGPCSSMHMCPDAAGCVCTSCPHKH
jgi:hypothetical protein